MKASRNPGFASPSARTVSIIAIAFALLAVVFFAGTFLSEGVHSVDNDVFVSDGIEYSMISDGEVCVSKCTSKAESILIPATVHHDGRDYRVTAIGHGAFMSCTGMTSVVLPERILSIDSFAFYGCKRLASIELPDQLGSIGDYAFAECESLRHVFIPEGLLELGEGVFTGCVGMQYFEVDRGNISFFAIDGILLNYKVNKLIQCPAGRSGELVVPESVTSIERHAFQGCRGLTSVVLPEGLVSIKDDAFSGCTGLIAMDLPDGLEAIGKGAFNGCKGLRSIVIPDSITIIDDLTFAGCAGMRSLDLGAGVRCLEVSAFESCTGLTSVILPDGLESIGNAAFGGCTGLTSMTIPKGVVFLHSYAFSGCSGITAFDVSKDNTKYSVDVAGAILGDGGQVFVTYPCGRTGDYTMPETVSSISVGAFQGCTGLTAVTISDNVSKISMHSFYGCTGLSEVTIPDSVSTIIVGAFEGCTGLVRVTLGSGVSDIGASSFRGCTGIIAYDVHPNNGTFVSMDSVVYTKDGTKLSLYPVGRTGDYVIPEGVTYIGGASFFGCTGLSEVTIPKTVTVIGNYAFYGCSGLSAFDVHPDNCAFMSVDGVLFDKSGSTLFQYPGSKPGAYVVPDTVVTVKTHAFKSCPGLTSISIPGHIAFGDWMSFTKCPNLKEVLFHEGNDDMVSIEGVVYSKDLTKVLVCPSGMTGKILLPEGVYEFGDNTFASTKLDRIVICGGNSIVLGENSFAGCNPNLVFQSGRDGYDLEIYKDVQLTQMVTIDELSSGYSGVLHLRWVDHPQDAVTVGPAIGAVAAILAVVLVILLSVRRP